MPLNRMPIGSKVIYKKSKSSVSPGPRATDIHPQPKGDGYRYSVEKFWTVIATHDDGTVTLLTRRGKQHRIRADDPQLRLANWWQRWLYQARFPSIDSEVVDGEETIEGGDAS